MNEMLQYIYSKSVPTDIKGVRVAVIRPSELSKYVKEYDSSHLYDLLDRCLMDSQIDYHTTMLHGSKLIVANIRAIESPKWHNIKDIFSEE